MSTETDQTSSPTLPPPVVTSDHGSLEARKAFNAALAAAQGEFLPIEKNRSVQMRAENKRGELITINFRYADLQEIQAKTRPALSKHGLSTTGQISLGDKGAFLTVILMHCEGFERVSEVFVFFTEDPKKFGMAVKYMRRYLLQSLLDVDADDDLDEDGEGVTSGGAGNANLSNRNFDAAPAPARQPARRAPAPKAAAPAQQPDDGIPPAAPIEGSKEKPKTTPADVAKVVNKELGVVDAMQGGEPLAVVGEDTGNTEDDFTDEDARRAAGGVVTGAGEENTQQRDPARDGPATTDGERAYLLKRCRDRGGDMRLVLDSLGYDDIDKNTLEGVTKAMWQKIKDKT